jgi:hypothetical protein
MELLCSCKANNWPATTAILSFVWKQEVPYLANKMMEMALFCAVLVQPTTSHPFHFRFISVLYSDLILGFLSSLFP